MSRKILITGCSSGIGAAMAREFNARGHRVYATARRPESLRALAAEGIATLPLLLKAIAVSGVADVVNVGSIVGLFTTPFAGAYCSSKAAFHALSDALRMELAPFGIRLIMVRPGRVQARPVGEMTTGTRVPVSVSASRAPVDFMSLPGPTVPALFHPGACHRHW